MKVTCTELLREEIMAETRQLYSRGQEIAEALDQMIEWHPDNKEFKNMRESLRTEQEILLGYIR